MSKRKWYVGVKGNRREPFASAYKPTQSSTPEYAAVIGPFVTKRGACFMAEHGANNPHIQTVADAERIAQAEEHKRPILELSINGDPYGGGFTAIESTDRGASWYYRGDIGAMPREWWRNYAWKHNAILRYAY